MRLAALGFAHETNTFARHPTTYRAIEEWGILRGAEIVRAYADSHATLAGFLEIAQHHPDIRVEPLLFTAPTPSGTISADAFERIAGEMLALLRDRGPWDGVLLAQHGAAVCETHPDMDGELAARVRHLVGPRVPIGMVLDMHANVSRRMVDHVTATVAYRTNPHLDARARAVECADIIVRTIRGEVSPVQALETPPLVINILKQFTGHEPMAGLLRCLDAVLAQPGMLSASVVEGYPYADVEEMGMAFLAIHDGDPDAARQAACALAREAWHRRDQFGARAIPPEAALRQAASAPCGPVVLLDVGDNIGGGSPGDSTVLLAEARRLGIRGYLQTLFDPVAVRACEHVGLGGTLTIAVGAHTDDLHGDPVQVTGRVRLLADGQFEDPTPTHGGARFFDQGRTAVLDTDDGHTLVLTSRLVGNTSIQQLSSLGIRPQAYRVVVAKGVQSPRPAYEPIATELLFVDTPGITTADLSRLPYRRRRRPLYPFEPDATY